MDKFDPYSFFSKSLSPGELRQGLSLDELDTCVSIFLEQAEELFGPRVSPYPWKFEGVNYMDNWPRVIFAESDDARPEKYIGIRLSSACEADVGRALRELTHECVHLLAPCGIAQIKYIEEGLACWYQRHWVKMCPRIFPTWAKGANHGYRSAWSIYNDAADMVEILLAADAGAIRRIRKLQPQISKITAQLIMDEVLGVDSEIAKRLVAHFVRRKRGRHYAN